MQVFRWANSLAMRPCAAVVEALRLHEARGDDTEIHVAGAWIFEISKSPRNEQQLARWRTFRRRMPNSCRFDRLEAHDRG